MQDVPLATPGVPTGQTTKGTPISPGSIVGPSFQLALLAAAQGNDQEAGDYLRQIAAAMKAMVRPGAMDAGAG
ncbi:hypothetical protein LCGC14_0768020 [marine sediment metagenome]|uniref:Uncharacterized protein n=1 Tax=marine sediment metagenome TaxID=412755 RepID=A0A0F9SJ70_9ZZZZ